MAPAGGQPIDRMADTISRRRLPPPQSFKLSQAFANFAAAVERSYVFFMELRIRLYKTLDR